MVIKIKKSKLVSTKREAVKTCSDV